MATASAAELAARLDRLPMTRHIWMLVTLISLGGAFGPRRGLSAQFGRGQRGLRVHRFRDGHRGGDNWWIWPAHTGPCPRSDRALARGPQCGRIPGVGSLTRTQSASTSARDMAVDSLQIQPTGLEHTRVGC